MTRNLKALGLAVFAILALGALTAQGASAAKEQEFRSAGEWTVGTGKNINGPMKFAVGSAGTIECAVAEFEDQSTGTKVGEEYLSDSLTLAPRFSECTFGGKAAVFSMNHCAFVLDSDLVGGNSTGGEHVNVEVECASENKIEIDTSLCTITVGAQTVKAAISYPSDTGWSMIGKLTAHKVVTGKAKTTENQTGCLLVGSGEIGTLIGEATTECYADAGSPLSGTEKTTPQGLTKEGEKHTECSIE